MQVSALDANNTIVTGYIGTIHFTSSDTQAAYFPQDVTLTGGSGNFVVTLKTVGTQTITATDSVTSSITGVSGSIAVSIGAVSGFAITPVALPTFPGLPAAYPNNPNAPSTFATTGIPVIFSVMAFDAYGNAEPTYNGTVHFTSSDSAAVLPASGTVTGGVGSFTATLMTPGSQSITAADINTPSITGGSGPIVTRGLVVTAFSPTPSGFAISFDKAFNPSTVGMYGSTPDDIILATTGSQVSVRGSVIFNASDTGMTFVKTDSISALGIFNPASGLLAPGNYTLTLRSLSGGNGFADTLGAPLDGTNTGSSANYRITFSVSAPPVAVGIPDFARGPSNTDAIFFSPALTNGSTFELTYTNPAANPQTGTATVTFSTNAATLASNIQSALSFGGLRRKSVSMARLPIPWSWSPTMSAAGPTSWSHSKAR